MDKNQAYGEKTGPSFYRWEQLAPILFLAFVFFLIFLARVMFSPLLPRIEEETGISHARAGSLFLIMSVGYFIGLTCSGFVSSCINHRRTIMAAACGAGTGALLAAVSGNLWHLAGAVLIVGIAAGLYLPSGITTLTAMSDPRTWGRAVSIHELAPNLAFVSAPVLAELFLLFSGWRSMPAAVGGVLILSGLCFALFAKGGNFPGKPPNPETIKKLVSGRSFWIMVLLFGLAISSTIGVYTMLPLYLVEEIQTPRSFANTLVAFSRLPGLAMALISGWAADRFGAGRTIVFMLGITGITTMLLGACSNPAAAAGLVILQASFSTGYFPPGFTLLSSIAPPEMRNVAVSFVIPVAFIYGGGLAPTVIGAAGDAGSFSAGFMLVGGLMCAGAFLPFFLRTDR